MDIMDRLHKLCQQYQAEIALFDSPESRANGNYDAMNAQMNELFKRDMYSLITEGHPSAVPYEDYMRMIGADFIEIRPE